jgi:hypothetical protein
MVREDEEDPVDVFEVGASYTFDNDMTLGVGAISTQADADDGTGTLIGNCGCSDETVVGVTLSGIMLGDFDLVFNFQSQDDDTSFGNNIVYGSFYLHTELHFIDEDSPSNFSVDGEDQDRSSVTLGYTQALGRKTTMWYEINHEDQDAGTSDFDRTAVMAVLKYDII